jgi:hypothetical protein
MNDCFGKMYPDLSRVQYNTPLSGKVFKVRINSTGLMTQSRQLECDLRAWEECQACESYQSCYDLSTGKLFMQQALARLA